MILGGTVSPKYLGGQVSPDYLGGTVSPVLLGGQVVVFGEVGSSTQYLTDNDGNIITDNDGNQIEITP